MREYLDRVKTADQYAQYVDDIGIAGNNANCLIKILRAIFETLTIHKCHFDATEINFGGRTITPEGNKPQKERITNFLLETKLPKTKKALQRCLGFLNYYRIHIQR